MNCRKTKKTQSIARGIIAERSFFMTMNLIKAPATSIPRRLLTGQASGNMRISTSPRVKLRNRETPTIAAIRLRQIDMISMKQMAEQHKANNITSQNVIIRESSIQASMQTVTKRNTAQTRAKGMLKVQGVNLRYFMLWVSRTRRTKEKAWVTAIEFLGIFIMQWYSPSAYSFVRFTRYTTLSSPFSYIPSQFSSVVGQGEQNSIKKVQVISYPLNQISLIPITAEQVESTTELRHCPDVPSLILTWVCPPSFDFTPKLYLS